MLQKTSTHGERDHHAFQREGRKHQDKNVKQQVAPKASLYVYVSLCFAIVALTWEIYLLYTKKTENGRDQRWDAAKFVFMVMVVVDHIDGYIFGRWTNPSHRFMSRLHMPGFSFVSGVFAAGSPLVVPGQSVTLQFKKLAALVCDLVLVNVTMLPVQALKYGSLSYFSQTPLVSPDYWYLSCLFAWQLTVPCLCFARSPILSALAIYVFVGWNDGSPGEGYLDPGQGYSKLTFFYVFFVAGFALAGGGSAAEERGAKRKALEDSLGNRSMLWASIGFLLLAMAIMGQDAWPTPWHEVFQDEFSRKPFDWEKYGALTQLAHVGWTFIMIFAALAIVFAIPFPQMIGDAGSRTLFVYVFHELVVLNSCVHVQLQDLALTSHEQLMAAVTVGVLSTLVLGSSLTETLTSPIVRPRWLLKLLIRPDPEEAKAEKK